MSNGAVGDAAVTLVAQPAEAIRQRGDESASGCVLMGDLSFQCFQQGSGRFGPDCLLPLLERTGLGLAGSTNRG